MESNGKGKKSPKSISFCVLQYINISHIHLLTCLPYHAMSCLLALAGDDNGRQGDGKKRRDEKIK